jgi:hypothetical protein
MSEVNQLEIMMPVVARMSENDGLVLEDIGDLGIDPEMRVTIPCLVGNISLSLFGNNFPRTPHTDETFKAYRNDYFYAHPKLLERSLFMPPGDRRRIDKTAKQLAVSSSGDVRLTLPGVVGRNDGIVVSEEEFPIIARSASDLAIAAEAKTRRARIRQGNSDVEEIAQDSGRAGAHSMESKIYYLDRLRDSLLEDKDVLLRVYKDSKAAYLGRYRTNYKAKNLDRLRKRADELIHETARVASINTDQGTTALNGIHRAIASRLYRRGTYKELAFSWAYYSFFTGRYINAKLGKIDQSRDSAEKELERRAHFLPESA